MKTFNIPDYMILYDGATKTISSIYSLNVSLNEINSSVRKLCDREIFNGPIANDFLQKYVIVSKTLLDSVDELMKVSPLFKLIADNYKNADKSVSDKIGGI